MTSLLGGGLVGGQPRGGLLGGGANSNGSSGVSGGQERGRSRLLLRKSFGNQRIKGLPCASPNNCSKQCTGCSPLMIKKTTTGLVPSLTPFRRAFNAGDVFNTVNEGTLPSLGRAPNQVNNIKPVQLTGLKHKGGGARSNGNSAFTGNPKFVYDGSDYTRFKNLQAQNRNYNDKSFGGNNSNAAQSARSAVRH